MSTQTDTARYELMVIVSPDIGENAIKKRLEAIKKSITDKGGEIFFEDVWGLRDLAYSIKKQDQGYYAVLDLNLAPEHLKEFDRMLRLETEVLRHLMIKLPSVYQPKTFVEMEAEAQAAAEEEAKLKQEKQDKKPKMGGYVKKAVTPRPEVKESKVEEKPAKAVKKTEDAEEAPKKTAKKKEENKESLKDIDAKLDSILSNPDINF